MTLLPDTLLALAASGASFKVSARKLSAAQLNQLAANAAAAGARLIVTDADSLSPAQAKTLVDVAGTAVEFDLS